MSETVHEPDPRSSDPGRGSAGVGTVRADRPSLRERLGYGAGDLASNLTWTTITSFLLFFYTDVALIGAAAAGTLLLVGRILDAIVDPAVGVLLDRTNTRFGRARPYLLFGAPVLAVLTVLTFVTPHTGGAADLVWAGVTFILVGLAYSLVNIPYGALMPMMTRDSQSRMTLSGFRFAGASLGLVVVSAATTPLVAAVGGGDQRRGFLLTVTIFAALGLLLFWIVAGTAKERVPFVHVNRERGSFKIALGTMLRNGPWLAVFGSTLAMFARLGVITGGTIYFALAVLGNPAAITLVLTAFSVSALAGSVVTPWVLRKLGHRRGIVLGLLASVVLTLALIPLRDNLPAFVAVFFVANIVGGFGFVAAPALISDTVEYQEHRSGQRNEGLLYSGYSLGTKVGTALGSALLAWGLAAIGYAPDQHTPGIATGVLWLYVGLPIVLALLQAAALACYRLEKQLPAISAELAARRASQA
ncbi:MFS transporter [Pseudonocardia halophobica]|uniref:MFS transporter n=1 Tax=Pseudonocardia halophobica TaxID=29401 RepID=A0A9W6NTV3_9PSEU|nr:MFS transporter [Pseudonocardia halophobica]GLL09655.1 MFS transporter [Pseudonocardia halophobica]